MIPEMSLESDNDVYNGYNSEFINSSLVRSNEELAVINKLRYERIPMIETRNFPFV